jgi:hypothetical protein
MSLTCWTQCLPSAIAGDKNKDVKPLSHEELLKPFMRAFDSDLVIPTTLRRAAAPK